MAAVDRDAPNRIPWWKEPTKDQWYAWWAAWLGWTLDAFDFTVFLLIIKPIADEFHVPTTEVAIVFTLTLWMRLVGAVASGWLADRVGRKLPLMISIFWYSICNFIAGFSPTFVFLLVFRTLLGIGMGAEWPAGAALAMEQWPIRSRGFMSGVLQGSWSIGFLLSSVIYGLFFDSIGWRGMLWIGVLPAISIVYIRYFAKEPGVWVENRKLQRAQQREVRAPLIKIFQRGMLGNTLLACWWMASNFVLYYSIWSLFATHLQSLLQKKPGPAPPTHQKSPPGDNKKRLPWPAPRSGTAPTSTPVAGYIARHQTRLGYAIPMPVGTVAAAASVVIALLLSPETKGKVLVAELSVA